MYWRGFVDPRTQRPFYFNFLRASGSGSGRGAWGGICGSDGGSEKNKKGEEQKKDDRVEEDANMSRASPIGRAGRQLPRSQSLITAQRLVEEKWGADADERKGLDTLGSARPLPVPATATGESSENVPLYVGNRITVVVGASAYRVVTEKATLTQVNKEKTPPTYSVCTTMDTWRRRYLGCGWLHTKLEIELFQNVVGGRLRSQKSHRAASVYGCALEAPARNSHSISGDAGQSTSPSREKSTTRPP